MKRVLEIMAEEKVTVSMSEGRRLILQGAVKVDDEKVDNLDTEITPGKHEISIGKKTNIEVMV